MKSRCARGWGRWGRLSDDGARQHNSGKSEDPWGGGLPNLHGGARSSARPDTARDYRCRSGVRERRTQTADESVYAGSRLKLVICGKVPPYMPAFQPYRGKPAVRNDRGDRGNVGIIRSPVRASILPDCGGCEVTRIPTATARKSWCNPAGASPAQVRSSVRLVASVAWSPATVTAKRTQRLHGVWD